MGRKRVPRKIKICARTECDNRFEVKLSEDTGKKYCSHECFWAMPKSHESNEKRRIAVKGEQHYRWIPVSVWTGKYHRHDTAAYRERIRERDNWTCQECGHIWSIGERKLQTHHIDYDKRNNDPLNRITLCGNCHSIVTGSISEESKQYFMDRYFQMMQASWRNWHTLRT